MAFDAGTTSMPMLDVDSACAAVAALARPLGAERVTIGDAQGRVLASPLVAQRDTPASPVSAMDGYAVRESDLAVSPVSLLIVGECFAGEAPPTAPLPRGGCLRVFTGAPLPAGADRVVMQEIVQRVGDRALIAEPPTGGRHARPAGADFAAGETLLPAGARLNAQALVVAAGADLAELSVIRRPRVSILGTGSELAEPGTAWRRPGAIAESVSFGVAALARDWGAEVVARRRAADDLGDLTTAAAAALDDADVVVVTGGASVGERDYAKAMFAPFGLEFAVCSVAMKPGKPVWVARAAGRIVVGLPGNPSAAMVTARLFLAPILAGLGGRDPCDAWAWRPVRLAAPLDACGDRETFVRAASSTLGAIPAAGQDSSGQRTLAVSDMLLRRRPGEATVAVGDLAQALPF
jgi:molybdopterin molybdotransferase